MSDPRRSFGAVLVPGLAGAALAAVACAKPWAVVGSSVRRAMPLDTAALDAAGQVPLASALSLVVLAAWGALLVTRGRFRSGFAVVGLLGSIALLGIGVRGAWSAPRAVRDALDSGLALSRGSSSEASVSLTGWFWVALVAVLITAAAFAVAVRLAPGWPAMGAKYDAPGAAGRAGVAGASTREPHTNRELWQAIDEGHDPTESGRP